MAAARQKLVLYIDVVSPWTYVAYTVLQRYKKPWNLDLVSTV
jgi:glutathione S-transferase kappa 1